MLPSLLALLAGLAHAGPVDLYGFGARQIARGSGGIAIVDDPAGVYLNPSALRRMPAARVTLGYAFLRTEFVPVPAVKWDTNQDGLIDNSDEALDVGPDYDRADGFMFSLGRPIGRRFGMSFAAFMPVDRVLRLHAFEPSLPSYFMYDNRPYRYDATLGFGWEQLPGLSVGGAVQVVAQAKVHLTMTLDATASGATEEDETVGDLVGDITLDVHELELDIVPSFAPVASVHWDLGPAIPALDGFHLGAVFRGASGLPIDVTIDLQANVHAEDLGEVEPMVLSAMAPIQMAVYDHFLPAQWSGGVGYQRPQHFAAYVDVRHTVWSQMRLNVMQVESGEVQTVLIDLSDPSIHDGNAFSVQLRDTTGVRVGGEFDLREWEVAEAFGTLQLGLRAGWGYEPSPLVSQGPESTLLDSDRMIFSAGAGVAHGDPFQLVAGPVRWDAFFAYHLLAEGVLEVADPNRAGAPVHGGDIPIGGALWAGGIQGSFDY